MTTAIKTNIRAAVVTPHEVVLIPDSVFDKGGSMADFIHSAVDGYFDCVRPNDTARGFVGYVHDEGLLLGLEPNAMASAVFGKFLVGNCVIVGAISDTGEYDGENHNLSSDDLNYLMWLAGAQKMWLDNYEIHHEKEEE